MLSSFYDSDARAFLMLVSGKMIRHPEYGDSP